MDVSLHATDPNAALSSTLKVDVKVYSENAYALKSVTPGATDGVYTLKYHTDDAQVGTATALTNSGDTNSVANATKLGTLNATDDVAYGEAQLTTTPNDAVPAGTTYQDTLTYYVVETAK